MLLKFAYDGRYFHGYQRQDNQITVEGEILKILRKFEISDIIKSASRTDRGVSALGNVIWIDSKSKRKAEEIVGILNSHLHNIYFHSYALKDINPRHARERWYRYHLLSRGYNLNLLKQSAKIFVGEHDFKNFTRARKNTVLKIDKIEIKKIGKIIAIDFFANHYLWNMIRRLVAAMQYYSQGNEFGGEIFEKRMNFGLAPPEGLILMDVSYDFDFEKIRIKEKWRERMERTFFSSFIYYYLSFL